VLRPANTPVPRWTTAIGALLAFYGLLLLTTPAGTSIHNIFATIGLGDLLTLACAIAFAARPLALSHASTEAQVPIAQLATLQIGVAAILMAITLSFGGKPHLAVTPRLLVALAVTSLLATATAFTIQSWAQQHLPPTHTAILLTLEPVFACLTSFLILHERMGRRSLLGAALILAGITSIELFTAASPLPIPHTEPCTVRTFIFFMRLIKDVVLYPASNESTATDQRLYLMFSLPRRSGAQQRTK
jgi:drug/metabolite transporter (DMT)-like permease